MHEAPLDDSRERILGRVLRRQAEAIPDAPYVLAGGERYSYGQVNELSNRYAAGLAKLGVQRGDTVACWMQSAPEFVFASFGALKLGAPWVPTNVDYKGDWLRESLVASRGRVLVADAELLPRLAGLAAELPFEHVLVRGDASAAGGLGLPATPLAEIAAAPAPEPDEPAVGWGDTAAVLWTSGTTGRAKGVMQSHNAWLRGALSGARNARTRAGDVMYCCLPMYNSAAWVANVYRALVCGLPFGLDPAFSASGFWERCRHYGATQIFTLGAMHIFLWNAPERPDDAGNPVRHASMVPLPEELLGPMKKRFGLESIDQGYGQSEVMGLCHRWDDGRPRQPGAIGKPIPGIDVRILDDDDREVAPGEVGELCVRPTEPHVIFNGYFHDPEATLRAFRNLWYHTGDLARRDEDGEHYFVDRKADYIRFKGRNVSSFAVEAAVNAHPAVAESAAHGVVSRELASEAEIKVCVVLAPGARLEPEALARFVNDNAPHFFVPRYVEFLEELPHTPTGRVQKYKLRERGVTPQTWDAQLAGFEVRR